MCVARTTSLQLCRVPLPMHTPFVTMVHLPQLTYDFGASPLSYLRSDWGEAPLGARLSFNHGITNRGTFMPMSRRPQATGDLVLALP